MRKLVYTALFFTIASMQLMAAAPTAAQVWDRATGQWQADAPAFRPVSRAKAQRIALSGPDATYRSCRRQVRRAAGIVPGRHMRLPRPYHQFIDRCVANGGVYS
jgi:hypothetical protein